ncbi:glycosyltransferase [Candidatus Nomurabacteria bacterium]|nr:MAG: glycosyltransferase [Candidatus Nomurabacteria bacterium]
MIVVAIGTERRLFTESSTRDRVLSIAKSFDEYHAVIFTLKKDVFAKQYINNTILYPTKSFFKILCIIDAVIISIKIIKNIPKDKFKDVVVTTQDPFECGLVGFIVSKITGCALNIQIHVDLFSPFFKNTFLQYIRIIIAYFVIRQADSIRCVSKRIMNSLREKKITTAAIDVVPVFIDVKKYEILNNVKIQKKDLFKQERFLILMASRLEIEKDISMALDVFSKLDLKYPQKIGLVIIGSGSQSLFLKEKVKRLKIESSVLFIPWINDLAPYYKIADLFWISSRFEGYGLTIIESLICGTPVLASDVGIASEVIIEGRSGWICSPKDSLCFFQKTDYLLDKFEIYQEAKEYLINNPHKYEYRDRLEYNKVLLMNIQKAISYNK